MRWLQKSSRGLILAPDLDVVMRISVVIQLQWQFMFWRKQESFVNVIDRFVKIFPSERVSMVIIFAVHDHEILLESILHEVL